MSTPFLTWAVPTGISADETKTHSERSTHYVNNCKTFMHNGTQIFPSREDLDYILMAHDMFTQNLGNPAIVAVENYEFFPPCIDY